MIIIVMGLPATGKTSFAEALAEALDYPHFNTDKSRIALGKLGQYDKATKLSIYQHLLAEVERAIAQQQSVIVDATFYTAEVRRPYLALAEEYHCPIVFIETKADPAQIAKRMQKRRKYSEADLGVYEEIKTIFEPLLVDHCTLWSDQMSIKEMIATATEYISQQTQAS